MDSKVIAVDIDLTVVDTGVVWWNWLLETATLKDPDMTYDSLSKRMYSYIIGLNIPSASYDLSNYFKDFTVDPMEFWHKTHLYDNLEPIEDSVRVLEALKSMGYTIIFVSYCFNGHFDSKWNFIDRHFPFNDGVIATRQKRFINCDYIIDDRIEYVQALPEKTERIIMNTIYEQGLFTNMAYEILNNEHNFEYSNEPKKSYQNYSVVRNWKEVIKRFI